MSTSSNRIVIGCLLACLLGIIALVAAAIVYYDPASVPEASEQLAKRLAVKHRAQTDSQGMELPIWLVVLIGVFSALQLIPLFIAAIKAQKKPLNRRDIKEISFLCETPMYLGLLGSLFGVCMTQFLTASLSAPMAYLTTIVGISLYLFAKFTIWLPLPTEFDTDAFEEEEQR